MKRETIFSPCSKYRYTLWREWQSDLFEGDGICRDKPYVMFIGLNPSTADETKDDPTIRRCIGFAKSWGYGALCMTNLFAWRETDSSKLVSVPEPIGAENDKWIFFVAASAGIAVAAWGTKGGLKQRDNIVKSSVGNLHYIRRTKDGHPEHPLYLPKNLKPVPFA